MISKDKQCLVEDAVQAETDASERHSRIGHRVSCENVFWFTNCVLKLGMCLIVGHVFLNQAWAI